MRRMDAEPAAPRASDFRAFYVVSFRPSTNRLAARCSHALEGAKHERAGPPQRELLPLGGSAAAKPQAWGLSHERAARRPPLVAGRHRPRAGARRRRPRAIVRSSQSTGWPRSVSSRWSRSIRRASGNPDSGPALAPSTRRRHHVARARSLSPSGARDALRGHPRPAGTGQGRVDRAHGARGAPRTRSRQHSRTGRHAAARRAPPDRSGAASHRPLPAACRRSARLCRRRSAALRHPRRRPRAATWPAAGPTSCSSTRRAAPTSCGPKPTGARSSPFRTGGICGGAAVGRRGRTARSERLAADAPARSCRRSTLPAMAGGLARADSSSASTRASSHLAAALGTPTLALFFATDPALAGVARASPHGARSGGRGQVPSLDDVLRRGRRAAPPARVADLSPMRVL